MERLTDKIRNFDGTASSPKSLVIEEGMRKGMPSAYCSAIVTKLADYEDAEEQGLLHKAPLKDGTPIWHLVEGFDEGAYLVETHYMYNVTEYEIGELGKDFWLSEEEAELEIANKLQSHAEAIMDERNGR